MEENAGQQQNSFVLVVEDNEAQQRTLVDLMKLEGFEVVGCSTAAEATEQLSRMNTGVVVLDLNLSGHSGTELLKSLSMDSNMIRVIIHTAYSSYESAKDALNLGAFAYVEKADDPEVLLRHVHRGFEESLRLYTDTLQKEVSKRTGELRGANRVLQQEIAERKQAEEKMKASQQRYRMLFNSGNDAVFVHRPSKDGHPGRFIDVNDVACESLGYTREELLQLSPLDIVSPEKVSQIPVLVERAFAEEHLVFEMEHVAKDGKTFPVEVSSHLFSHEGQPMIIEIARDITERKKAEEEMRIRARILENMIEGVNVSDESGIIVLTNPSFDSMFGYERGELIGKPISILNNLVEEENARFVNEVIEHMHAEGIWSGEIPNRKKDGTLFTTLGHLSTLEISGKPYWISVQQDITERKRAEEELFRYASIASSSSDMMAALDANFVYLATNEAYLAAFGMTRDEVVGHAVSEVVGEEFFETTIRPNAERCLEGNKVHYDNWFQFPVLGSRYMLITYSPHIGQDGEVKGFVVNAKDITERKRAEEEIRENQRRLRSLASELSLAEERQRHRIATELHDTVSQMLAFALTKLQNIHETASGDNLESLSDICGMVSKVVGNMRSMTFDICSPTLYKFDLETAVSELLDDKFTMCDEISYSFRNDSKAKPLSEDIKIVLFQSIRELVNNIIKHAQAHNVEVDIQRREDTIRITVNDDGIGFNVEELKLPERSRGGFGLFSIGERLEYIGGSFKLQAQPGRGSSFTLEAPLEADAILCKGEDDGGEDINC